MGIKWTNAKRTKEEGNIKAKDSGTEKEYEEYLINLGLNFIPQPVYILQEKFKNKRFFKKKENTINQIKYTADFLIENEFVIEVKGMLTADYRLRRKLFLNKYSDKKFIEVVEVPKYISKSFGIKWMELNSFNKVKKETKKTRSYKEKDMIAKSMKICNIKCKGKTICLYLKED